MINFNYPLIGGKLIERKIKAWKAEARAESDAEWSAWNNRRIKAENDGVPFSEPPPSDSLTAQKERE